ncbi:MAG: 6-bladed beta-propeller [Bacteroidales bacterium]|nr:6-bladed beta-propeller [Bacteroidales bacterium]
MRWSISIAALIAIVLSAGVGCSGGKQSTDDLITVDVTKSYSPKKELILQDFMDVEYIALETKDDFYNQGFVEAIGKEIILVKNIKDDGNIFVYDRTGKALRKINRLGRGGEEYAHIYSIILDEDNSEMFVNDYYSSKLFVYDLYGNFKRSIVYTEGARYLDVFDYDRDHLICYDNSIQTKDGEAGNDPSCYFILSKQDGSIIREIKIPFEKVKSPIAASGDRQFALYPSANYPILPDQGHWILREASSDTVYRYSPDGRMNPFIVRTPSIQSMSPEIFLFLTVLTDRYYFMEALKKGNPTTRQGFPKTYFMYDRQEKAFFGYTVYNGDYSTKKEIYMNALRPVNHEIESWQRLNAEDLVESYRKGELNGRLKEIAATLDEESNPVIMLVKHKK